MKSILITIAILVSSSLFAQNNMNEVLVQIEENNTTLKALKEQAEAQKLGNKTGIFLPNPQVEFNYLWGNPNQIGNRNDISVNQTFDFATVSGMRKRVADKQNDLLGLQYKSDRMSLLLEAKQYCIDLIYYNALKNELDLRLSHAETIAKAYKEQLDKGNANILEYNKAQLNLLTLKGEISRVDVERNATLLELKRLNGGTDINLPISQYPNVLLPANFDDWFAQAEQKNPVLEYVRQEVEVSKKQVSLNKTMSLPSLSAGFMREKVVGEAYNGISLGLSIPLWENKNRVKQAKAAVKANELKQTDSRLQFYNELQNLYNRANGLKTTATEYRKSLVAVNSTDLLKKALDAGEISLLDYIVEIGFYYNTVNLTLEAERDFEKAFAELSAVEL